MLEVGVGLYFRSSWRVINGCGQLECRCSYNHQLIVAETVTGTISLLNRMHKMKTNRYLSEKGSRVYCPYKNVCIWTLATYRFSRNSRFRLSLPWRLHWQYLYLHFSNSHEAGAVISDHITSHVTYTAHRFVKLCRTLYITDGKFPQTHNYSLSLKYHLIPAAKRKRGRASTHDECIQQNVKRLINRVITSVVHVLLPPTQKRYCQPVGVHSSYYSQPAVSWSEVLWWGGVTETEHQAKWMHCQESWRGKLAHASTECGNC